MGHYRKGTIMRHYFLPKQLKKGDRVVIWGAGCVGKQYISQAKRYGISVVKLLDTHAELVPIMNHYITPEWPKAIKSLEADMYDYILIAVENIEIRNNIKNTLKEWNIDSNKVLMDIDYYDDVQTINDPEARAKSIPHFSWYAEDVIISNIFYRLKITNPSYMDIGCNDPYLGNNTAFFYLTGSRGICVDANPARIDEMRIKRPDDLSLCLGIVPSEATGKSTFFVMEEDALSTFSKDYLGEYSERHSALPGIKDKIEIETHTLQYLREKYCDNKWPDFLDIDIEGLDDEVIQNTSFISPSGGPIVISIESHDKETRKYLRNQGYFLYTYTVHNDIWVRNEYRNLIIAD